MTVTRSQKEKQLQELEEKLAQSQALLFTDFRGLKVGQIRELRLRLREMDCGYQVVKNRLLGLALTKVGVGLPAELLSGPTGIAFCYGDVVGPAKALLSYAEETKLLSLRGGVLERRVLAAQEAVALAKLPSREELLRRLLGQMQAPLYGLGGVLQAPLRKLVGTLVARQGQLEKASG